MYTSSATNFDRITHNYEWKQLETLATSDCSKQSIERHDAEAYTYFNLTAPAPAREYLGLFKHENYLYIPSYGCDLGTHSEENALTFVCFELRTRQWSAVHTYIDTESYDLSFTQDGGVLYMFDGKRMHQLEFDTLRWESLPGVMPTAWQRSSAKICLNNHKVYALGGQPYGNYGWMKDFIWYNLGTGDWEHKVVDMLCADGYAICSHEDKIYCFGGSITSCMESSEIKVFDTKSLNMEKYENEVNDVVQPMRTYYDVAAVFKINGEKQIVTTSYDGTIYIVDLKTKKYVNEFHFRAPLEEAKKRIQGFDEHNLYRFEFLRDEKTYKLTRLNIVEEQTGNLGNALFDSRSKFGNISFVTQK